MKSYEADTAHFSTIVDFIRFGMSQAYAHNLHYGHGTDNAEDDIYALILGSLALPFNADPALLQAQLTTTEKQLLTQRLAQRIFNNIPVPYLTQQAHFCGLAFYVDGRVLIPRSPIAELITQLFSPWLVADNVAHILDLCTGSGCLAIACSHAFPEAHVDAVDLSPSALEVATINRERHGLEDKITLIESDCWSHVPKIQYNLIVSNPPYVSAEEMASLPQEYFHEPRLALEAGKQGLAVVEKILQQAENYLAPQGILIVEVGNSEQALIDAFPMLPFTWLEFANGGQGVFLLTKEQLQDAWQQENE